MLQWLTLNEEVVGTLNDSVAQRLSHTCTTLEVDVYVVACSPAIFNKALDAAIRHDNLTHLPEGYALEL